MADQSYSNPKPRANVRAGHARPSIKVTTSKGRAYYYLRRRNRDGAEVLTRLSARSREQASYVAMKMMADHPLEFPDDPIFGKIKVLPANPIKIAAALARTLQSAQKRATQKKLTFDLDLGFLTAMAYDQNFRCAVSGLPFVLTTAIGETVGREPYRPSIDRIDYRLGYVRTNVRLVCTAVNFAIGAWGDDVFATIIDGVIRTRQNGNTTKTVLAN